MISQKSKAGVRSQNSAVRMEKKRDMNLWRLDFCDKKLFNLFFASI